MANGNDYEPSPEDLALGITKIRPMADGYTAVHVDLQKARQNPESYLQRAHQMIDDHLRGTPDSKHIPDLKATVRLQLKEPASATNRLPVRFIAIDEQFQLADFFNHTAKIPISLADHLNGKKTDFGTRLAESLGEEAQARFINAAKFHEEGHTIGKHMGLDEGGADYYAAVKLLKTDPAARETLQLLSDARIYSVLTPDHDNDIDPHDGGTYLAISRALSLTPEEVNDMNEEEIVARAAQFDALAGNRENPPEFTVKNDIFSEMIRLHDETGRIPPLKQAVDSLVRRDIYAKGNEIAGDDNAMKDMTLRKFAQALDRLEQKGIDLPESFTSKVQSYQQLLSTIPKPPAPES